MVFLLLAACAGPKGADSSAPALEEIGEHSLSLEVSPSRVDFGVVGGATSLGVSLQNTGDEVVDLLGAEPLDETLSLEQLPSALEPGASVDLVVTWSPLEPGAFEGSFEILAFSASAGYDELVVPALGTASWPVLSPSVTSAELGFVDVGCADTATLALGNAGTEDLVIDSVGLSTGESFTLSGVDGELPALPWTIAPGDAQTVLLTFAPVEDGVLTDTLSITSNDPGAPVYALPVQGEGHIVGQYAHTYEVEEQKAGTILIAANEVVTASVNIYHSRWANGLPYFFETLLASKARFRVALIENTTGEVYGDIPYIDESFSVDEAVSAFEEMADGDVLDNDYLLDTFDKALDENSSWLLDESALWADSKLSLIAINNDVEQSAGNATVYVNAYLEHKSDPEDLVVSSITGGYPRGCSEAEPAELLYNAALETGGTLHDFCEPDWSSYFEALALDAVVPREAFLLSNEPAIWSIEVTIDGVDTTEGWTYDATAMEIVFDEEHYPSVGSLVRIEYIEEITCDE